MQAFAARSYLHGKRLEKGINATLSVQFLQAEGEAKQQEGGEPTPKQEEEKKPEFEQMPPQAQNMPPQHFRQQNYVNQMQMYQHSYLQNM